MTVVIEAKGLTKLYDGLVAVDGIDFTVETQECFGFLGPNGAGKTTTMRMIYCFSPITRGALRVASMDVKTSCRQIKAIIGVVPQENNLDPDLTVMRNLVVYARYFDIPQKVAEQRATESLELLQLLDRKDSPIDELSGGMKRRLMVARALINEPKLLILDEPTTGLDPQARHLVWQKLRYLKSQGVTLVLTTHYMEEAAELCDRIVIMDSGKILTAGRPTDLIVKYVGREVLELRLPPPEKRKVLEYVASLKDSVEIEEVEDILYLFSRDDHLLDGLPKRLDAKVDSYVFRPATLEDVFLKLAGRGLKE